MTYDPLALVKVWRDRAALLEPFNPAVSLAFTVVADELEAATGAPSTALVKVDAPTAIQAKTATRKVKEQALDLAAEVVFRYWRDRMGFNPTATLFNDKRKARIIARLRENGGDVGELLYVVDGAVKDDWTMGRDARSSKAYNGTETVFRDREKVEGYLQLVKDRQERHPYLDDHAPA